MQRNYFTMGEEEIELFVNSRRKCIDVENRIFY